MREPRERLARTSSASQLTGRQIFPSAVEGKTEIEQAHAAILETRDGREGEGNDQQGLGPLSSPIVWRPLVSLLSDPEMHICLAPSNHYFRASKKESVRFSLSISPQTNVDRVLHLEAVPLVETA